MEVTKIKSFQEITLFKDGNSIIKLIPTQDSTKTNNNTTSVFPKSGAE